MTVPELADDWFSERFSNGLFRNTRHRMPDCETCASTHKPTFKPPAANDGYEPIVLKNSVFGKIREIFAHTAQSALRYEGFGPIGLIPLIRELTASLGKSHLTFPYHGSFPKKHGI